jgi:myo-inositol-1(or 4)-monophosphatase
MEQYESADEATARLAVMRDIAREAGTFVRGAVNQTDSTDKSNTKDFVTVADIKAQNILRDRLQQHYPKAVILSEEDDEAARQAMYESDFTGFVLDPIDGTYNFKRDMRESGISVGYIEHGQSVAGVIYDPYKDELYEAVWGGGAFRNGEPIHVSNQTELAGASIATSNSYDDAAMAINLRRHLAIYETAGVMPWTSCPGSGVLIMAWIACGRIDAYHHNGLKPWDNAAAFLLVQEARGQVTTLHGETATFSNNAVIIGNPTISRQLIKLFSTLPDEFLR